MPSTAGVLLEPRSAPLVRSLCVLGGKASACSAAAGAADACKCGSSSESSWTPFVGVLSTMISVRS